MSYDVCLVIDTGGPDLTRVTPGWNYTFNCRPMFMLAMNGIGISDLDGKNCAELQPMLDRAIEHMDNPMNREIYVAMNPPNGWGNFDTAREFFRRIVGSCRVHPKASVRVT